MELVEDKQPEVRVQASRVLSDLLQCQFIPDSSALLVNVLWFVVKELLT